MQLEGITWHPLTLRPRRVRPHQEGADRSVRPEACHRGRLYEVPYVKRHHPRALRTEAIPAYGFNEGGIVFGFGEHRSGLRGTG